MGYPKTINGGINLTKIDPSFIVVGKNGDKYLNLRIVHTPDDKYGNDFMITQDLDKATREKVKASGGEYPKTPILGNGKVWDKSEAPRDTESQESDLPF